MASCSVLTNDKNGEEETRVVDKEESSTTPQQPQHQHHSLRIYMTDVYFSVTEKLLERLRARLLTSSSTATTTTTTPTVSVEVETNIKKVAGCDLVIGDRHGIPYHVLRAVPARPAAGDAPPLINFFEGAQRLTLKVSMSKLLKDFEQQDGMFCPKSFVLAPKEDFDLLSASGGSDIDASSASTPAASSTMSSPVASFSATTSASSSTNVGVLSESNSSAANSKKPVQRKSALPSKAERAALAAKAKAGQAPDERAELQAEMKKNPETVWIAKPTAGSKGIGIILSRDFDELCQHVETFNPAAALSHAETFASAGGKDNSNNNNNNNSTADGADSALSASVLSSSSTSSPAVVIVNPKKSQRTKFIVQKYIDNPLLVKQRKFDIRVWCALSSPKFQVSIWSEGSCRTASIPYSGTANLGNTFEHVTNHDLQQYAPEGYGELEAGNEMWYAELEGIVQERYAGREDELRQRLAPILKKVEEFAATKRSGRQEETEAKTTQTSKKKSIFEEFIRPQLHYVIIQSFLAARQILELSPFERFQAFQLYGFDMMLDEHLNCHLLEINGAPGVAQDLLEPLVDGAIDELVAPRMPASVQAALLRSSKAGAGASKGYWETVYCA